MVELGGAGESTAGEGKVVIGEPIVVGQEGSDVDLSSHRMPLGPQKVQTFESFEALSRLELPRIRDFGFVSVSKTVFEKAQVDDSTRLVHRGGPPLSRGDEEILRSGGASFQGSYGGEAMSLEEAVGKMRAPVDVQLPGRDCPVSGIPLFGAVDTDNVTPIARAVALGLQKGIDEAGETGEIQLVDIGMGWGFTAALELATVLSALEARTESGASSPKVTLHLVDPRLDPDSGLARLGKLPGEVFEYRDYHPEDTDTLGITEASSSYLPKEVQVGQLFMQQIQQPGLSDQLADMGVKIVLHRAYSDEFFERNEAELKAGTVACVVIDGEHGVSESANGGRQLQPLVDVRNALDVGAQVIATDDNKNSKPCCGVMVAVHELAQQIGGGDPMPEEQAAEVGLAYSRLEEQHPDAEDLVANGLGERATSYTVVETKGSRTAVFVSQ